MNISHSQIFYNFLFLLVSLFLVTPSTMSDDNNTNRSITQEGDDDDLSSAGIIQKTLEKYESEATKSSFVLPPTEEISFFPSTTPVADKHRRSAVSTVTPVATVASYTTAKWNGDNGTFEEPIDDLASDSSNKKKVRNVSNNRKKTTYTSTSYKKHSFTYADEADEVQLMKVENKKKRAEPSDKTKTQSECKKIKTQPSMASLGFVDASPPFSEQALCTSCGNRGYMCHNYQFSGYCTKACMSYLQFNHNGWQSGFNVETMERVFYNAYNEVRRVNVQERFGYYCPGWIEIPECMRKKALATAVDLGYNPKLCDELRLHNENGKKKYEEAQDNHRA